MHKEQMLPLSADIKIIIGLGNPGPEYYYQHHSIGFRIVDELAKKYNGLWQTKKNMETASILINNKQVLLVKPQTFMNSSGAVIPALLKQGLSSKNMLVVHDELEKKFGTVAIKKDGSHRGHNGLRSLIEACGPDFFRLRFGIDRPANKADVPEYVLQRFAQSHEAVQNAINQAILLIESLF